MSFFQKFKSLIGHKSSTQKSVELMADLLTTVTEQRASYEGMHSSAIDLHIAEAKTSCQEAFEKMKVGDESEAYDNARRGLIHLHIADLLMHGKAPEHVELNVSHDTVEGALNDLIHRIARVKLLVEYGDLLVTVAAQESLLNVLRIFDDTAADLQKSHLADARRGAGAALVALHWTICLLEGSNPTQSLSSLKISEWESSTYETMSCELAEKIMQTRVKLGESIADPSVATHVFNAEKKFAGCLENLIDGDAQSISIDCRAAALEIQLAEKEAMNVDEQGARRTNHQSRQEILEFKQDIQRVIKLAEQLDVDNRSLERRLQDCEFYFIDSHKKLEKNDFVEAERLARAAHLDLDFSWQIANALPKAQYRSDI